jgi:hypothetical protein
MHENITFNSLNFDFKILILNYYLFTNFFFLIF